MRYERFAQTYLDIKSQGGNEVNALCPLPDHHERHPSFRFNVKTGLWVCLGCQERGNAMKLAGLLKVNLLSDVASPAMLRKRSDALRRAHGGSGAKHAMRMPESELRRFERSVYWYDERGFSEPTIQRFQLGFDPVTERLTIPLRNSYGDLLGVIYRRTDDGRPKYLNPRGFARGRALFASCHVRKSSHQSVAIVEGPLDAVRCWDAGVPALALFGSSMTEGQVRLLRSMNVKRAVIMTDNDAAGRKAVDQVREALKGSGCATRPAIYVTKDNDPGEMDAETVQSMFDEAMKRFR